MATWGTLAGSAEAVVQGEEITFRYRLPNAGGGNWVGVYADSGAAALREGVREADGSISFSSAGLAPGRYRALLVADGDRQLSDPVAFAVREPAVPEMVGGFGRRGSGPGQFDGPSGIAVDARGRLWVADTGNDRVQGFTRDGELVRVLAGRLRAPEAVAVDQAGNVFVADTGNSRALQYSWWGGFVREFGPGLLERPRGIALDGAGRLLVADAGHGRVARFDIRTGAALPDLVDGVDALGGVAAAGAEVWAVHSGLVTRYAPDSATVECPGAAGIVVTDALYVTVPDKGTVLRQKSGCRVEFGADGDFRPYGIAVGPDGEIHVVDHGGHRVVHFGLQEREMPATARTTAVQRFST